MGTTDRIRIARRFYYKQLHGPDVQIADSATRNEIAKTYPEATLDEAAEAEAGLRQRIAAACRVSKD